MVRRAAVLTGGLLAAGALTLVGCGTAAPTVLNAAPEPGVAPVQTGPVAGTSVALSVPAPEGIVVDGASRDAVIATRDPDRILIVDVANLAVLATLPAPGAARHLELDGPEAVIVPGEDTDELAVLAIPSGAVLSEVRVGRQPHDATALPDGTIVVGNELAGTVSLTRGDSLLATVGGLYQPGGVAQAGGLAAVVDVRGRLLDVIATDPLRVVARVAIGAGPTHAVGLGDGTVAVADTDGGAILIVRVTHPARVLARIAVPGRPYGLAVDLVRHRLWVTTTSDNLLHEYLLPATGAIPVAGPTFPTVTQPNSIAVIPSTGAVLVVGATTPGRLQEVVPA